MRTKEIIVYQFKELSEKAQQRAIEHLYNINVSFDWWDSTYEDAERVGLKITEFDLDRNRHAEGLFINSALETANLILKEHVDECESFKTATNFLADYLPALKKWEDSPDNDGFPFHYEDEAVEMAGEFLKSILEDYSIILQNESEYLTSREALIEAIEANEYEFTENGEIA